MASNELELRVQMQLDKLNSATELINRYEFDLQRSRNEFKDLIRDCSLKMDNLRARLGLCVERAKPYYCAEILAAETSKDLEQKSQQLEKALSANTAAKEMISLAEQGIGKQRALDGAWQEMLNHAIGRVHETDVARESATAQYRCVSLRHEAAVIRMRNLHNDLKRSILKSSYTIRRNLLTVNSIVYRHQLIRLPYYEMKVQFIDRIRKQKDKLDGLKADICASKLDYANALKCLEEISDGVHRGRQRRRCLRLMQTERCNSDVDVSVLSYSDDDLKLSPNMADIVFGNAKFKEFEDSLIVLEELKNTKEKSCSLDWVCAKSDDGDEPGEIAGPIIDPKPATPAPMPTIKRKQSLDSVRDFLSTAMVNFNSTLLERRNSESKFFEINNISLPAAAAAAATPSSSSLTSLPIALSSTSSFIRSFPFAGLHNSDTVPLFDAIEQLDFFRTGHLNGNQTRTLIIENDLKKICEKLFGESFFDETP